MTQILLLRGIRNTYTSVKYLMIRDMEKVRNLWNPYIEESFYSGIIECMRAHGRMDINMEKDLKYLAMGPIIRGSMWMENQKVIQ